jgi:hypothetical protein
MTEQAGALIVPVRVGATHLGHNPTALSRETYA